MATFYFHEYDKIYALSNSLGEGFSVIWRKEEFTREIAIQKADAKVGEYIRQHKPKEVKYIILED